MELIDIPGIGPKTIIELKKLNILNISDLIEYYPFRYEIIKRTNLREVKTDDKIYIDGIIESYPSLFHFGSNKSRLSFKLNTGSELININVFNQSFLKPKLNPGVTITVGGKINKGKTGINASEIRFEGLSDKEKIEGVYSRTKNLSSKKIHSYIDYVITNSNIEVPTYIPDYLKEKYHFKDKNECIKEIHKPTSRKNLEVCSKILKYEELFMFLLKIRYLKLKNTESKDDNSKNFSDEKTEEFINNLSFKLTEDQIKATKEILEDLRSKKRMNRLLQGDVGSGKTIVSFIAIYASFLAGFQSALMVPTEVLAIQHFNNAKNVFKNYVLNIEILTSSTTKKNKEIVYEKLKNGEIDLLIGTHSLIQEKIVYNNLGLVITDEQQRFGVNQRSSLRNKGKMVEVLYMSATPIPRTYALTIYGDMDISIIKTKPHGRKEIITYQKRNREIVTVLEIMKRELELKHQVYVITPMIEESDDDNVASVDEMYENMVKAFGKKYKVASLHGKLKSKEKDKLMNEFALGNIDILVSTTVIEVGVDVPNASLIVIFDANHFGLSTIHQLRGRVGRNDFQSYCVLVSEDVCERLDILEKTTDGFLISEYDFNTRKEGDLFGTRQHGDMDFNIADIKRDFKMLEFAKKDAEEFLPILLTNNDYPHILNSVIKVAELD